MNIIKLSMLLALLAWSGTTSLFAQTTITVINTNDNGTGSLRQAVADASDGDIIRFAPALIASGSNTIQLTSSISFSKQLTLIGLYSSTDTLYIAGDNQWFNGTDYTFGSFALLDISNVTTGGIYLDSICMTNGGPGVRITTSDSLNIDHSLFTRCGNSLGGAIESLGLNFVGSTVNINNSVFRENVATSGGAVYAGSDGLTAATIDFSGSGPWAQMSFSEMNISNSTFENNRITNIVGTTGYAGGAICSIVHFTSTNAAILGASTVNINNSTFNENSGVQKGGVIYSQSHNHAGSVVSDPGSFVNVDNSTFSENNSTVSSDMISSYSSGFIQRKSIVTLRNSTVIGADASFPDMTAVKSAVGGPWGPFISSVIVEGSIVKTTGPNFVCLPTNSIISNGYNVFSDTVVAGSDTSSISVSMDQLGIINPMLAPLSDNGGATFTRIPMLGSPAIDAGNPADLSDAQNAPIMGTRNIGAAEDCFTKTSTLDMSICFGLSYTSPGGQSLSVSDTYFETIPTVCGADSVITINLTVSPETLSTVTQAGETLTSDASGVTYQWIDCIDNSPISGATAQSFVATVNGSYAVIIDNGNCSDTSECMLVNTVGLEELEQQVSVYPNPTTGLFTIHLGNTSSTIRFNVISLDGKTVAAGEFKGGSLTVDLSNQRAGVYLLQLDGQDFVSRPVRVVKR